MSSTAFEFLILASAYGAACFFAVRFACRWARRKGRSPVRWGLLAAFVMYNLVFWEWIPALVVQQYQCQKHGGLRVYKSPEAWRKEYGLPPAPPSARSTEIETGQRHHLRFQLNERVYWESIWVPGSLFTRYEYRITDFVADETLAEYVTFGIGWFGNNRCPEHRSNNTRLVFNELRERFK